MGKNQMPSYASQVTLTDRWAVIAYVRVLQRTRLGTLADVPEEIRPSLKP
jgi:mono/diheme cytochrome c family protein